MNAGRGMMKVYELKFLIKTGERYRVGGRVAPAVLPHHRTYGSVYGGSRNVLKTMELLHIAEGGGKKRVDTFLTTSDCLVCDFCSSGRGFACGFLQIPPRDGHPCRPASGSRHQGPQRTFTSKSPFGHHNQMDGACAPRALPGARNRKTRYRSGFSRCFRTV